MMVCKPILILVIGFLFTIQLTLLQPSICCEEYFSIHQPLNFEEYRTEASETEIIKLLQMLPSITYEVTEDKPFSSTKIAHQSQLEIVKVNFFLQFSNSFLLDEQPINPTFSSRFTEVLLRYTMIAISINVLISLLISTLIWFIRQKDVSQIETLS